MSAILHSLAQEPTTLTRRTRRVSRHKETHRDVVLRSVPQGAVRAAHGNHVMRALLEHPEYARRYASAQRTLHNVLRTLIQRADYETMTTRPGWDYLAEVASVSRRTIARALKIFQDWGLLGIVASGRSAQYATKGPDGERTNEAAVYVLCTPSPLAIVETASSGDVDEFGTPPALGGSHLKNLKETHTRARETNLEGPATPAEPTLGGSAASAHQTPYRPELNWPTHKTTASKKQRLAAASELRRRIFLLRPMSTKDVASSVRDFLIAGWTVADLHHALDFQPNGSPWPYSGIPTSDYAPRLRGWMRTRLAAWRTHTGEPLRSRDQRSNAQALERRAQAARNTARLLQERAERATRVGQDSPAKIVALAQIRALRQK